MRSQGLTLVLVFVAAVALELLAWIRDLAPVPSGAHAGLEPAGGRLTAFSMHRLAPRPHFLAPQQPHFDGPAFLEAQPEAATPTSAPISYENGEADLAPIAVTAHRPTPSISYEDGGAPPDPVSR